jgi:hypothetical protein
MVGASGRKSWRQPAQRAVALLLVAGCAALLVDKAGDGVRSTDALSSQSSIDRAADTNAFYTCIENQVMQLIPKSTSVAFSGGPASAAASTLISAAGTWFTVARNPAQAKVTLSLSAPKPTTGCSGLVVTAVKNGRFG